jgi:hypothetical protein
MATRRTTPPAANASLAALERYHTAQAQQARSVYLQGQTPNADARVWQAALHSARTDIRAALSASAYLNDIGNALQQSGAHMLVFRHLMAPPLSQDQFKLICPSWQKGTEKSGRPMSLAAARVVVAAFAQRRLRSLTPWIDASRAPTLPEVRRLLLAISPLIAIQRFTTERRNAAAAAQEQSVIDLLQRRGWTMLASRLIDTRAALAPREFMHKTRFATSPNASQAQEVDIACGLRGTYVLAMECKVTNDETNSVKRINDVLKKATAWQNHWGNFVETAALLQGVIKPSDVHRLLRARVHVFWSHDLAAFEAWISARV